MARELRRRLLVVLVVPAALALGSCGGGDDKDAHQLLDAAFGKPIPSADVKLDAELRIEGRDDLRRPIRVEASGPYRRAERGRGDFDLDVSVGSGGQTLRTGVVSVDDRAFVKFEDVYYEAPRRGEPPRETSLEALGLDPRKWLAGAGEEGEEEVGGVETTHVSGKLDAARVFRDFNELVRKSGGAIRGATGRTPKPLSEDDLRKVTEVVKDPSFDVYVGSEDDVIRRISGRLEVDVPEGDRKRIGGISGGSLELSLQFDDVGGDQKVEAPANARPLSDLTTSLGAGALGSLGGGTSTPAPEPRATTTPDAEAYKRYAECLDRAAPDDTDALQRCSDVLP